MSAPIRAGGLASGIDTNGLVNAMVNAARQPIRTLQDRSLFVRQQRAIFQDLNSKLSSLGSTADSLSSRSDFLSLKASTSDSDYVTASASGSAGAGTYKIDVSWLAETHKVQSATQGASDASSAVAGNTFDISVDGEDRTVTVDTDGATLSQIASAINADAGDLVSATIVSDPGSGNDTLFIESRDSGTAGEMTFTDTDGVLEDIGVVDGVGALVDETVSALDARIFVDGVQVDTSSNSPTDVIDGLTLNLLEATTESVTVTVEPDKDAIISKVKDLVSGYNRVVGSISTQSQYNGEDGNVPVLSGDSTLRRIKTSLQSMITGEVSGITHEFNALSRIGVSSDRDGVLSVDEAALGEAIGEDFSAVAAVFIDNDDEGITGVAQQLVDAIEGYTDEDDTFIAGFADPREGLLATRIDGIEDILDSINAQVERIELRVGRLETSLIQRFASMEVTIAKIQQQSAALGSL